MTSESDNQSRRRPPTIDLTATEVEDDKPASTPDNEPGAETAPTEKTPRPNTYVMLAMAGAAIGALVIVAAIAGLDLAGYLQLRQPAPQIAAVPPTPATDNKAIADITAQLNKIQGAISAQQPDPTAIPKLAAIEATTKSLGDAVAALTTRVDQIAGAVQAVQTQAKSAADAAAAAKSVAQSGVTRSDIDQLNSRLAALESSAKSLSDNIKQQATNSDDGAARLIIVTEALRAAVERGAPFQAELASAKLVGADQKTLVSLEPFAASGVPATAVLARELAALAPALTEAAEPKPTQGTFLERIEVNAQRLVRSTPVDAPAGDDPRSVAIRVRFDAAQGDIDAALVDIAKLPDAAKSIAAPWVQKAQARNTAIAASRQLAANALAALGKPQ